MGSFPVLFERDRKIDRKIERTIWQSSVGNSLEKGCYGTVTEMISFKKSHQTLFEEI